MWYDTSVNATAAAKPTSMQALRASEGDAERERFERGLEAIRRLCQRVGRILAHDDRLIVKTHFGAGPARAWIADHEITFAQDVISNTVADMTDRTKVCIYLLFHELGHYRDDPRPDNAIWKAAMQKMQATPTGKSDWAQQKMALNILLDQRHEIITSMRYPIARDYFFDNTLRDMKMVIDQLGGLPPENHMLYYGRRHILPAPILAATRKALVDKHSEPTVVKAEALIDEFLPLTLSDVDVRRMWDIADELRRLFTPPQSNDCIGQGATGKGADKGSSDKASRQIIKDRKYKAGEGAPLADFIEGEGECSHCEGEGTDGEGKPCDKCKGTGKGKGESQEAKDGQPGKGAGRGWDDDRMTFADGDYTTDPKNDPNQTVAEMIDAAAERADAALAKDLAPFLDAVKDALNDDSVVDQALGQHIIDQANRITRMFEKINVDLDLQDVYGLKSGRLDVRRVVQAMVTSNDRIFRKRQQELTEEAKMGVFISVDASGSMSGSFTQAMDAGLTIGCGAEKAGHMVKIIAFDSGKPYDVVKGWFSKAYHRASFEGHGGGTPFLPFLTRINAELDVLHNAEQIRHSVVFVVTDGEHGDGDQQVRAAMRVTKKKHATHIYWIGIGMTPRKYPEVERVISIRSAAELEHAMRNLMRDLAQRIHDDVKEGR